MHRYDWTFTIQLLQKNSKNVQFRILSIYNKLHTYIYRPTCPYELIIIYHKVTTIMHFKDEFTAIIRYPGPLGGDDNSFSNMTTMHLAHSEGYKYAIAN